MFHTIQRLFGYTVVIGLVIAVVGCQFDPSAPAGDDPQAVREFVNAKFANAAPAVFTEGNRQTVYAVPNRIMVQHGYGCAEAAQAAFQDKEGVHYGLRIQESLAIPAEYGDTATVFLNGWRLEYTTDDDHHVEGLGAAIFNIQQTSQTLQWQAGGILSDKNGDDDFKWCYYYTVVIWRNDLFAIDASPTHADAGATLTFFARNSSGDSTAQADLPGLFQAPNAAPDDDTAVLPRGFGMMWEDEDDHHLLQQAFDFGDSMTFIDSQNQATTSWISQVIFKDNSTRRDYFTAELVSLLSGLSVTVIQPDFAMTPRDERMQSCPNITTPGGVRTEQVVINDLPFDHAIPMLTGWDIGDVCEDSHVKQIGAWIENWHYAKQPGPAGGTLTYTIASTFADDGGGGLFSDAADDIEPRYKVSILGLSVRFFLIDDIEPIDLDDVFALPTPGPVGAQPAPEVEQRPDIRLNGAQRLGAVEDGRTHSPSLQ